MMTLRIEIFKNGQALAIKCHGEGEGDSEEAAAVLLINDAVKAAAGELTKRMGGKSRVTKDTVTLGVARGERN